MKNKMLARRIAIAMLSAGMAVSATPVGAFAATVTRGDGSAVETVMTADDYDADEKTLSDIVSSYAFGVDGADDSAEKVQTALSNLDGVSGTYTVKVDSFEKGDVKNDSGNYKSTYKAVVEFYRNDKKRLIRWLSLRM